jgi:hypothetical protein
VKTYRVSNVESFRQYEQDEEAEADDLIANIRGEKAPSAAMLAGTAFHKALELAQAGDVSERVEALGHVFTFACDVEVEAAPVREMRASKTYMVDGEPITISGQVDALFGKRIDDHKTTGRFDPERYIAGCQWKLYLDIFGADLFRWNVFELQQVESTTATDGFDLPPPEYEVIAQHTLEQFSYPTMGADCQRLVERFARFVRERIEVTA